MIPSPLSFSPSVGDIFSICEGKVPPKTSGGSEREASVLENAREVATGDGQDTGTRKMGLLG